ncbi:MAG: hypothetical protein OEZ54_07730, partial [Gemmatimonadota bacterium]|nr:hypothetical protein [Gemmatimonadota bacterium]
WPMSVVAAIGSKGITCVSGPLRDWMPKKTANMATAATLRAITQGAFVALTDPLGAPHWLQKR